MKPSAEPQNPPLTHALLTEEEARQRILQEISPLPPVRLPLLTATGRFAAHAVRAVQSLPGFDNSSMDGYAVTFPEEVNASPSIRRHTPLPAGVRLQVEGEQPAGRSRGLTVRPGRAVRIFTGAPIPEGTGAVVMQEDVRREGDEIILQCPVEPGEFIRRAGGDVARGQLLFEAGARLTPQRLGLLASQGFAEIEAGRAPRVAVLATGDELRAPGEALNPGEIYESNGVLLASLAASLVGAENVTVLPRAADERADLDSKLTAALGTHDVLVIAGGVSVGERDLVKERLAAAGVRLSLWRVAIQPGKPFLYGRHQRAEHDVRGEPGTKEGAHVFGLPGNPVSAFVTFLLFARPALLRLMGARDTGLTTHPAVAGEEMTHRGNRPHFLRGRLDGDGRFFPSGRQESHALFGLSHSDALVRLEPGATIPAGADVRALLW